MLMEPSCSRGSYELKLSGPVTIGDQWTELDLKPSIKTNKDLTMILLDLEPPFKNDFYNEGNGLNRGKGILTPEGEVVNPEIEVIDENGNTFNLVWSGSRGHYGGKSGAPAYDLPYPHKWPRDREFTKVRIRSGTRIKCKAIYWFFESTRDWK
jgi:hypothetical protein